MKKDSEIIVSVFDSLKDVSKYFDVSESTIKRNKTNNRQYEITTYKDTYNYEKDCYEKVPTVYEITSIVI